MKAVILAGGKGTRLAPYTTVFPKPLVPLGHQPILEVIVRQLAAHGFADIVMSVGYLAELIQAYFETANHKLPPVNLSYVKESEPTGTAGSLALIPGLDEAFLVMNGDVLTSLDYRALVEHHRKKGGTLTIAMHRRTVRVDFGVIRLDGEDRITGYEEKPSREHMVSMGVYVYEPRVLDFIEPGAYLDLPDLVLRLLDEGEKVVGYPFGGHWLDIGRHQDYEEAQALFSEADNPFLPDAEKPC